MDVGDTLVAVDDLFSGWEETFTQRRRKNLENQLERLRQLSTDLAASEALYRSLIQSIDEVSRAQGDNQALVNAKLGIAYPEDASPVVESSTVHTLAKTFKYVTKVGSWSLTAGQLAVAASLFSMPRTVTVAAAEGIELTVIGSIAAQSAQASTIASVGEGASRATRFALMANLTKWADTLSTLASVAGFVVLVIESVLSAVQVASMRRQANEAREKIEALRNGVGEVSAAFAEAEQALAVLYGGYASEEGSDTILEGLGARVDLAAFRKDLRRLPELVTGEVGARRAFADLRSTLIQRDAATRAIVLDAIKRDTLNLQAWTTQIEMACRMLEDGIPAEQAARLTKLSPDLVDLLKLHVERATGLAKYAPKFNILLDGTLMLA